MSNAKYLVAVFAAASSVAAFAAGNDVSNQSLGERLAGFGEHAAQVQAASLVSDTTRAAVEQSAAAQTLSERLAGYGENETVSAAQQGGQALTRAEVHAQLVEGIRNGTVNWRANS